MEQELHSVRFAKAENGDIFSVLYKNGRWTVHRQVTQFIEGEVLGVKTSVIEESVS